VKRFERRRLERIRRGALASGLSFAIGALTASALTWRHGRAAGVEPAVSEAVAGAATGRPPPADAGVPTATIGPAIDTSVVGPGDRDLAMPVDGVDRDDLRDTFSETRGGTRPHEALDIMAPRGTPVRAVRDGHIEKLFDSQNGGLTIYQFDPSATYAYYYAHLDHYAPDLREKQRVKQGDLLGFVGSTGNAAPDAPHLHFAVFRLSPERQWWKGEAINPYPILK
jgi:murein DD-endopeptidase MepM/ murein hydrolase activator NlpD